MFNIFRKKLIYFLFLLFVCNGVEYFCDSQRIEPLKTQNLEAEIQALADKVDNATQEFIQMVHDMKDNDGSDVRRALHLVVLLLADSATSEENQKKS